MCASDNKPKLVEGDYIETVEGLLFSVKGLFHTEEQVIAYLRYIPDPDGDRKRGSTRYRRVYDLEWTHEFLIEHYPQYLSRVESRDLTLQSVPFNMISRFYRPKEKLRSLVEEPTSELEKIITKFATAISSEAGIAIEKLGVSGSVLIDLASSSSDVDLVVYGTEAGRRAYEGLISLRNSREWINAYNLNSVNKVVLARWVDTGLDLNKLSRIEVEKVLHGMVDGKDYFMRLVKKPEEVEFEKSSRPLGSVRFRGKIIDADGAIFTPCTYKVDKCILMDFSPDVEVTELISFRGKFTEQARKGDTIEAKGSLEEVQYPERTVYRVVMGSKGDYLAPVNLLDR